LPKHILLGEHACFITECYTTCWLSSSLQSEITNRILISNIVEIIAEVAAVDQVVSFHLRIIC